MIRHEALVGRVKGKPSSLTREALVFGQLAGHSAGDSLGLRQCNGKKTAPEGAGEETENRRIKLR